MRRADGQRMAGNGFGQADLHHQYSDIDALVALDTGKEIQHPFIGYIDRQAGKAGKQRHANCLLGGLIGRVDNIFGHLAERLIVISGQIHLKIGSDICKAGRRERQLTKYLQGIACLAAVKIKGDINAQLIFSQNGKKGVYFTGKRPPGICRNTSPFRASWLRVLSGSASNCAEVNSPSSVIPGNLNF